MRILPFYILLIMLSSCSKQESNPAAPAAPVAPVPPTTPTIPVKYLETHTSINQKTSWYITNKLFDGTFFIVNDPAQVHNLYNNNGTIGFNYIQNVQSYFSNRQGFFMGDLNGDGKNDIFNNYWPAPHGTNKPGYYITWEFEKSAFTKPNIIQGLTGARKLMFNDYYGNGKLGLLIASSGVDALPFPGDSVQIVSFGTDLSMTIKNITEVLGYYHSGSSGDVDNDGDIDLLMYSGGSQTKMGPVYFENIGNGNFKYNADLITGLGYDFGNANNYYCMELFDINKDGYLDLILGGDNKSRASRVIWGTATHKFNANNQSILPAKTSFSSVMDMAYTDMDKDGDIDIILLHEINYQGFGIQILENQNNTFVDVTSARVDVASLPNSIWAGWMRLYDLDKDGDYDLVADGFGYKLNQFTQPTPKIIWVNDGKGNFKSSFFY